MKKKILFLCIIIAVVSFVYFQNESRTNNAVVTIDNSSKFSKEEINNAVNCVKKKFMHGFSGCTLTKLWYDEEKSNSITNGYLKNGKGSVNGAKAENVIVLLSNFKVDSSGTRDGFEPNSTYSGWNWILIRDSKTGKWRVDDWGY